MSSSVETLAAGREALARGAWEDARALLDRAARAHPADAPLHETLGIACGWLQDIDGAIRARERAFSLYREAGDDRASARVSLELANDFFEGRGEGAIANGWFQRARRLLADAPPCRELAMLGIWDAYMALMEDGDPGAAEAHAARTVSLAREVEADDMAMLALALQGLSSVTGGRVREGLSLLDEAVAAVIGREVSDPQWFYLTCCCMIDACDRVRDFGRSMEWCRRLREFAERWRVQAFLTTCRVKYTGALMWRGEWEACEAELQRAMEELARDRPSGLPAARVRMAELRRRQGHREEAEALLERAAGHPLAPRVRAELALDVGDAEAAVELLEGMLRRLPEGAPTERTPVLEGLARARARGGDAEGARAAAEELDDAARRLGTRALGAAALAARGAAAATAGDHPTARELLADALHLYEEVGSPWEAARTRVELARSLAALGRRSAAIQEVATALDTLEGLGAAVDAARARELLDRLEGRTGREGPVRRWIWGRQGDPDGMDPGGDGAPASPGRRGGLLTPRQRDVLALVARGMSDREMAKELFLSEHTVHRHVANILRRLEVSSRSAAVARAVREGWL